MSKIFEPNLEFMQRAIDLSERAGIKEKAGGVFGAIVAKDNEIIGEGYNQVIKYNDPTWHAEMQAIREAGKKLNSPHLTDCVLYTSAESCPMCLSAIYLARIEHIFYASNFDDAVKYGDFSDANIYFDQICKKPEDRTIKSTIIMRSQAVEIWKIFAEMPNKPNY